MFLESKTQPQAPPAQPIEGGGLISDSVLKPLGPNFRKPPFGSLGGLGAPPLPPPPPPLNPLDIDPEPPISVSRFLSGGESIPIRVLKLIGVHKRFA